MDRYGAAVTVFDDYARTLAMRFVLDVAPLRAPGRSFEGEAARWIDRAGAESAAMTAAGLPVYNKMAPPLRPGFPWAGEWHGDATDVLYPVRPHRFAFLPRLALAILGDRYSRAELRALLGDWMDFASRDPRLPFISTFVVTQRLLAVTCALSIVAAAADGERANSHDLCESLLRIAEQDVAYLLPRLGLSYPNGHLLTDRFAGWLIAAVLPELTTRHLRLAEAERLWTAELTRQTYGDGGSFEHALHYHGLATELAAVYLLVKRRSGTPVQPDLAERIRGMLQFQADLAGPDGSAPTLGDATEDPMLPLDGGLGTTPAALREIYRRMYAPRLPPLPGEHPANERAFWLLPRDDAGGGPPAPPRRLCRHLDAGVFVFREDYEATRCVFRTGPPARLATIAGHMHADLLSVCWTRRNAPLVVDPGTYTYRRDSSADTPSCRRWREYLVGPCAHNGIVVGDIDPLGPVVGDFRAGAAQASVRHTIVEEGERLALVEASIVSPPEYANVTRGVLHVPGEYFVLYACWPATGGAGDVSFPLQFDHRVQLARGSGRSYAISGPGAVDAALVFSDELEVVGSRFGSDDPMGGWVSPRYGEILPAAQLVFRAAPTARSAAFALVGDRNLSVRRIVMPPAGGDIRMIRVDGAGFSDRILINTGPAEAIISAMGIEFAGRLLWLRTRDAGVVELRALGVDSCSVPASRIDVRFPAVRDEWHELVQAVPSRDV